MKTQGITLMTSKTTEVLVTKKSTKASDSTFDNFISNNASGLSRQTNGPNASIADTKSSMESKSTKIQTSKKSEDGSSSNISQSKDADKQVNTNTGDAKVATAKTTDNTDNVNNSPNEKVEASDGTMVSQDGTIDIEKVNEEIMAILQDVLNLMPQDVQDIFNQMGMQPSDLITGLQTGEIQSFSITTVQTFVMEVHGIEDPSAFLTNDILNQELNSIFDQMKSLLSELMGVDIEGVDKLEEKVWQTFSETLMKLAHPEISGAAEDIQPQIQSQVQNQPQLQTEEPIANYAAENDDSTETGTPDMSVIIENRTSDNAGSGTGQNTGQGTGLGTDDLRDAAADLEAAVHHVQTTNAEAFAEALTEAIEPEQSQMADVQRQMTEMVEQVVRQVRVRMMPESTNMELQLHPASLGRVNVQIAASGQETTARLIVETQAAKDALESGMIRLQEAFEERGLKVQAVEVTIGNFDLGLNQQTQSGSESENAGNSNGNRGNGNNASEEDVTTTQVQGETEESRRDINSTVDYTA
ncbi:MAG: flagellar hook-length control protein FliK [Eubacterium sp.]|nr:flagellar hook-length control protein FliK [Eubacterium sp.]